MYSFTVREGVLAGGILASLIWVMPRRTGYGGTNARLRLIFHRTKPDGYRSVAT